MAVNLFKITVNGTEYIYTDEKTWVDSKGRSVTAPKGIGVPADNATKNSDGTLNVTVNKEAFSTIATGIEVTLKDLNAGDRKLYRLALGSGYTSNEIYGGRQSVGLSDDKKTLNITGINAGLLVNADGTSITYATPPTNSTATVTFANAFGSSMTSGAITVSGRTIIINDKSAFPANNTNIEIKEATDAYSLALGSVSAGYISEYTAAGWSAVASGSNSAIYYSGYYTAGYYRLSNTQLANNANAVAETELFRVNGISSSTTAEQLGEYFAVQTGRGDGADANVSLKTSGFEALQAYDGDSAAITIKDADDGANYVFAIGEGVNTAANPTTPSLTADYKYTTAGNSAYANLVSNTITVYDEIDSKSFSLSGLAAGQATTGAVSVAENNDGRFLVTLGQSALNSQNIFAYGDDASLVGFSAATGITSIARQNEASIGIEKGVLTYIGASAASAGYYFNTDNNYVLYYASVGAGGESFKISGLSTTVNKDNYGTITPGFNIDGSQIFNIALSSGALSSGDFASGMKVSITAGANNALNYSLTVGNIGSYLKDAKPDSLAAALTYNSSASTYEYVGGYTPDYFSTDATVASLATNGTAVYTYTEETAHPQFSLSGLSNAIFGTTDDLSATDYLNVSESVQAGSGSYIVEFTPAGISALLRGAEKGETLTIVDNDQNDKTSYLIKNPQAYTSVGAAFDGSVTSGKINFKEAYTTAGWSTTTGDNTANGYSSVFIFNEGENKDFAFSLSGLTGFNNATLSYASDGGGISVVTSSNVYAFGTLSSTTLTLSAAFFDNNSTLTSVTLIDDNASDGKWYKLALSSVGMPTYGVSSGTVRNTVFNASASSNGSLSNYYYISGGLSDGYGLYSVEDSLASASAGITTVTKYAGTPSSTFTINGLVSGITTDQVLDYASINAETFNYYVNASGSLAKGNYVLTESITLSKALNISDNVAIDLGSYMISNASGSVFNVTGGELIISGNGSIQASATSTAIAVSEGSLIVNGGNIKGTGYAIADTSSNKSSNIVINGGTVNGGISSLDDNIIVTSGSITGANAINLGGGQLDVMGGNITGTSVGVIVGGGSLNVFGGTITGLVGLSVGSTNGIVNILGGTVTGSGSYAIINGDNTAINIGRANVGSLSNAANAGGFSIFADYEGKSYGSIGGSQQTSTGSYSSYLTYSGSFSSILNAITYPTFGTSAAVIVGASAGGYVTLNSAALKGVSTATFTKGTGNYAGLELGNDVTKFADRVDKTVTEGWMLTGVSKAGMSFVDTATYQATNYLDSWQLSNDKQSVTHYGKTGGAQINVSGLSLLTNDVGSAITLTDGSLSTLFSVTATGGGTESVGSASVTGYTLTIANDENFFKALAGGESLSFKFDGENYAAGGSVFNLVFASTPASIRTVYGGDSTVIGGFSFGAQILDSSAGTFTYRAAGTSDYFNLSASSASATDIVTLNHVATNGLEQFSISGFGDRFSAFSTSAITGSTSVYLLATLAAGGNNSVVTIGHVGLSGAVVGSASTGVVMLYEDAFIGGSTAQTITLTDTNMDDGVYYRLYQGSLSTIDQSPLTQTLAAATATAGYSSYTFTLGGSYAYYVNNTSGSAVGGISTSTIIFNPQIGGQSFVLDGLVSGITLAAGTSLMLGDSAVGSIVLGGSAVVYGGSDSLTATVTLADVAAMGSNLSSGQSIAFSFKDSNSLDSVAYSLSLGSDFKEGSKTATPGISATFSAIASGYSFATPAYDRYTENKGNGSYIYHAPETPSILTIAGLSAGLAAASAFNISTTFDGASGANGITTVSTSGANTLFTVQNINGGLSVVIFESALSSVAQRGDITVSGASLSALSFDGTLGQSGITDTLVTAGFSSTAGGSFIYQAAAFKDYYSVGILSTATNSISALHFAGTGGQSFTFTGLSTGDNLFTVSDFTSAISVTSTSGAAEGGGFSITGYTFEVGSISFLNLIPQGQSLAVAFNGTNTVAGLSLTINSSIITSGTGAAQYRDKYVVGASGIAPQGGRGLPTFTSISGGESFLYTASLQYYDWFSASAATIVHHEQTGGQQFSISGIADSLAGAGQYSVVDGVVRANLDSSVTPFMQVKGASVYLTAAAFGGSGTITLKDLYDGTENDLKYKIVGTSAIGYLNNYSGSYISAKFESLLTDDTSGKTYHFTASGINDGINIGGYSVAGLSVITATYVGASGSEQFNLSGLSVGMIFGSASIETSDSLTSFKFGGASVIDVTGISTGNINVMVYAGALSATAGRTNISLTGGTTGYSYSLSLASDLLLGSDSKPSYQTGHSLTTAIDFTSGNSQSTWNAPVYNDYYIVGTGANSLTATYYGVTGGQSFTFSVLSSAASPNVVFTGSLSVLAVDGSLNNGQYEITNFVFGISKAGLGSLSDGQVLAVAGQSGYTGNYSLSFMGTTGDTADKYGTDVIMTASVSSDAKFTSVAAGSYNFADSVKNYAWYDLASSNKHSITFHEQQGGESFNITGLATGITSLGYSDGVITGVTSSGQVTIGSISFESLTNGSGSRYGYVYLTEAAFGGTADATVKLTDSDTWGDGTYYSLVPYSGTDSTVSYLKTTGEGNGNEKAHFKESGTATDGRYKYTYTAAITGAGVSVVTGSETGATTLKYIAQSGGQSFTITGLKTGLPDSVDSGNIISDNVTIGTVDVTGDVGNQNGLLTLMSPLALGTLESGSTRLIELADNKAGDGVDYKLTLGSAFNIQTSEPKASIAAPQITEEGNTGTYDVQVGGIPAWSQTYSKQGYDYQYTAAKDAKTYVVAGLRSGLSSTMGPSAIASVFGTAGVTLNESVIPDTVTTVQILNNTTAISLGSDSSIAHASLQGMSNATRSDANYQAQTYKPWTTDTDSSDGLTIYPSVGGEIFDLTNFGGLSAFSGDKIITSNNGTITAGVTLNESTGAIDRYTFTVSGRSALDSGLNSNSEIKVSLVSGAATPEYTLSLSGAIAIGTGTPVGTASLDSSHAYTGTGISEHVEASVTSVGSDSSTLVHSYSYHPSIKPVSFAIQNLKDGTLSLGSDVFVSEVWSGDSLSAVNITLTGGALAESTTSDINIASSDSLVTAAKQTFALSGAGTLEATSIIGTGSGLSGSDGDYFYQRPGRTKGYYADNSSNQGKVVYSSVQSNGQSFSITGLATGLGQISLAGESLYAGGISDYIGTFQSTNISINNPKAFAENDFTFTDYVDPANQAFDYNLTIADGLLTVEGTSSPEEVAFGITNRKLTYTASVTAAHYNYSLSTSTGTSVGSVRQQQIYTYVAPEKVGYDFYFDGGFNKEYDRSHYGYSVTNGVITATLSSDSSQIKNLATIAGGISGTISIGADAFDSTSSEPLYLTYASVSSASAGYKLALAEGLKAATRRSESFKETNTSDHTYRYEQAGNNSGYEVISYSGAGYHGGSAIQFTSLTGGNNFELSGLKGGMSLSISDGIIYDTSGSSSVAIGTYTTGRRTDTLTLNDNAFEGFGGTSFVVKLSGVSNTYNQDSDYGINNVTFDISGSSFATGTAYTSKGGSFADAMSSGDIYSITYKENAQDAYWYGTGKAVNDMKSFTYMPTRGASDLFSISGFSVSVTGSDFAVNGSSGFTSTAGSYAVNVADSLLPNAENETIALTDLNKDDGFDFYFAAGEGQDSLVYASGSSPDSDLAHFDSNVFTADYRRAYNSISADNHQLGYVKAEGGQSFSITGLADGIQLSVAGGSVYATLDGTELGQVGTIDITSSGKGVFELTNTSVMGTGFANGESKAIVLTDLNPDDGVAYSLSLGSAFNVTAASPAKLDSVVNGSVAGSYVYNVGALSSYAMKGTSNDTVTSYTYYAKTNPETFTITGLSTGLVGANATLSGENINNYFVLSGDSVAIQDVALVKTAGNVITFDGDTDGNGTAYSLVNPVERKTLDQNFAGTSTALAYLDTIVTAGYSGTTGTAATLTYAEQSGGDTLFTVTGLSSAFNAASASYSVISGEVVKDSSTTIGTYAGNTFTLNDTGLAGATKVSISGTAYNLAISGVDTEAGTEDAHWVNANAGVSYVTESNKDYWSVVSANKAYEYNAASGGEAVFGIHGLAAKAESLNSAKVGATSIATGGYSVTIAKAYLDTTAGATVSITGSNNELYFDNIDTISAAGYSSLQLGDFSGTTYSIGSYAAHMIENTAQKKYTFAEGSETEYVFGISVANLPAAFSSTSLSRALMSGGNSILFKNDSASAVIFDKDAKTVYIYNGIFGGGTSGTVELTGTSDIVIAAGDGLNTIPGKANNNNWSTEYGNIYYSTGVVTSPYFSRTDDKTLTYVKTSGGDVFKLNNPSTFTSANLNAGAISVSTKDGANYVFTINNENLRDYAVGNGGLSIAVFYVGDDTRDAGLSLSVAFAVNSSLGNNAPSAIAATFSKNVYTGIGTSAYYKNVSSGLDSLAVASLESVAAVAGDTFTITGLTPTASLASDGISIVKGTTKLVGIDFTGDADSTGRHSGKAYVRLTEDAFDGKDGATITVVDGGSNASIAYGLSYGGDGYLNKLGDYNDETFSSTATETGTTYNYSASTREQGITISDTVATYSASVGYGDGFSITNLADNLSVSGGKVYTGTTKVGEISGTTFTLTSLSALSTAAQNLSNTTTFTLKDNGGAHTYSLSVAEDLTIKTATLINETLTTNSGVNIYAAAHSSAYVAKAADNSYTYGAEEHYDTFSLSGNGLASGLSLGSLSISDDKKVTLLESAFNANVAAGDTIVFDGDTDKDGTAYTINDLAARVTVDAHFAGTSTALAYLDTEVQKGWDGEGGSTATFTYASASGGNTLFTVNGLSAAYTGTDVSYSLSGTNVIAGSATIGTFGASTLTLNATALAGASFVNLEGAGYSLAITGVSTSAETLTQAGFAIGTRTYYSAALSSYWSGGDNAYTFNAAAESAAQFSLSGVGVAYIDGIAGVSVADSTVVTINNAALSGANVTLTNLSSAATYGLSLGSNVAQSAVDISGWTHDDTTASYMLGALSTYYTLDTTTKITHHDSVAGASAIVLEGIRANSTLAALTSDNAVVLNSDNFSTGGVTIVKGSASYSFTINEGTYNNTLTGMSIADTVTNSGSYIAIDVGAGNDFINLAGGASSTLTLGEGNDTISVGAGVTEFTVTDFTADDVIVGSFSSIESIDGGIKADNVSIKGIAAATDTTAWQTVGDNINYVSTSTSGATLDGGNITFINESENPSTLFTIFNVNSSVGVSLNDTIVTLGQSALAGKSANTTVSLSGAGYSLALDSTVAQSAVAIRPAGFDGAIYSASAMSAYWGANGTNAYILNASTAGAAQFSLTGAISLADSIVTAGYSVIIGTANLAGTSVTLTNLSSATATYSLALDGDHAQSVTPEGFGSLQSGAATYYGEGKSEGYELSSSTLIAHLDEEKGDEYFTASNISTTDNVKYADGAITASNETGAKLTLTGLNAAALTIGGFAEIDGLNATRQTVAGTPTDAVASGDNLVITTADGTITIDGAAAQTVNMAGDSASYTATFDRITDVTNATAKSVTLTAGFTGGYYGLHQSYGNGVLTVDASKADTESLALTGYKSTVGIALTGASAAANTITGGHANDTLTGGSGDDSLKGNAGEDLFVQSAGNDTITDYTPGEDKISLASALSKYTIEGSNVVLTTEDQNTIVIVDGVDQTITTVFNGKETPSVYSAYVNLGAPVDTSVDGDNLVVTFADETSSVYSGKANDTVTIESDEQTFTATKDRITDVTTSDAKAVTLTAGFTSAYYNLRQPYASGVTKVDASKATSTSLAVAGATQTTDLNLKGSDNVGTNITGGSGNDTLIGGAKDDTLTSNAGNDVFVQSEGNDTITDYKGGEDKISLASALTATASDETNVTLTTADGTIIVRNGVDQPITTVVDGTESTTLFLSAAPTNASVDNDNNLVVTTSKGDFTVGGASDTVTMYAGDRTYTAVADRITDVTDSDAKAVTLTTDFTGGYYGLHQSYGSGVFTVDASNANTTSLNLTGYKSTEDIALTGATKAANTIIGGSGNDTLTGGSGDDSLKGNAGNDVFVQTAGSDTIVDYTTGEDKISLASALSSGTVSGNDVILTTSDGTIIVKGANNQTITTIVDGTESTTLFASATVTGVPVDTTVDGSNLVVTFASGKVETFTGAASEVVTINSGDGETYTAAFDRITNITNSDAKAVTLTGGFTNGYYGLHQSYGSGVFTVDATKVEGDTLILTGYKSTAGIALTGASSAANNITGGHADDTLTGGTKNDTLKGNAGADTFVQSGGNDTIVDYTPNEDVISLTSAFKNGSLSGYDVILTTEDDNTILVTGGKSQSITTSYNGTTDTLYFDGETVVSGAPVDVTVSGNDLVVELTDGTTQTLAGSANSTVTMTAGDHNYSVQSDRITDFTTDAKEVTLASGFTNAYYNLNQTYASGVTKVDASKATSASLVMTGSKQTSDLNLKGSDNVGTNITGGTGNDTLKGGELNDTLNGGSAGNDIFVQSGGNDTITNYTGGEDKISLSSALTATTSDANNVSLTTAAGTIIVRNGVDQSITTVLNDTESTLLFLSAAPTNASLDGTKLVVTTSKGDFTVGSASDTVTLYAGGKTYTAAADRITDVTTSNAKAVTLTTDFTGGYYGLHYSYANGVTALDASNANTTSLNLTGYKSTNPLNLIGANKADNSVIGGKGNDTLMGGTGNNTLKGNAGADLFIQNGAVDVILDYTEEDTIQLASAVDPVTSGNDVTFTNSKGTLTVLNGSTLTIRTTVAGGNANLATNNNELWGTNDKDTFLFDGGNDTIHNYEEQDSINLGRFALSDLVSGAPSVKDNSLIFEFDRQNSLKVVDALDKTISFTDGTTYSRDKK